MSRLLGKELGGVIGHLLVGVGGEWGLSPLPDVTNVTIVSGAGTDNPPPLLNVLVMVCSALFKELAKRVLSFHSRILVAVQSSHSLGQLRLAFPTGNKTRRVWLLED